MLIHAIRRTEPTTVELFDLKIEFKPNEHRHCIAEVTHAPAIERLLSINEGYVEYGVPAAVPSKDADDEDPAAAEHEENQQAADASPLVLVSDTGEKLDLTLFTAKQVREYAKEHGIDLPGSTSTPVAELRLILAKALTSK
jgi:hypothetical protein